MLRAFTAEEIRSFFEALGQSFDRPATLVIVGGAGAILQHGATRPTVDIDTYSVPSPPGFEAAVQRARDKTELIIPIEYPAVAQTPWNYEDRLESVTGLNAGNLSILVPERHDLALMKVMRSYRKDLDVIHQMHDARPFDLDTFVTRFTDEMTHVVADQRILRQKFLLCVEELFGERSVEPTREAIERTPVVRDFQATTRVRDGHHLYRIGIRPETLADDRFLDTVRQSHDGTIVFPFRDLAGITGLGLFRGGTLSASGRVEAGLWTSKELPTDTTLVFVDSPLEALAYQQTKRLTNARYLATGHKLESRQRTLVLGALTNAPAEAQLVLAFAAGPTGSAAAAQVSAIAKGRRFERHRPEHGRSWTAVVEREQSAWIRAQGLRPLPRGPAR